MTNRYTARNIFKTAQHSPRDLSRLYEKGKIDKELLEKALPLSVRIRHEDEQLVSALMEMLSHNKNSLDPNQSETKRKMLDAYKTARQEMLASLQENFFAEYRKQIAPHAPPPKVKAKKLSGKKAPSVEDDKTEITAMAFPLSGQTKDVGNFLLSLIPTVPPSDKESADVREASASLNKATIDGINFAREESLAGRFTPDERSSIRSFYRQIVTDDKIARAGFAETTPVPDSKRPPDKPMPPRSVPKSGGPS